jgi:CRP-like cAMP-binding protein
MEDSNAFEITLNEAYGQLFAYIRRNVTLTKEDEAHLRERFQLRKFSKKQFFLQEGQKAIEHAYVVQGCMRVYYQDQKMQEHVLYFGFKDWWVGDLGSFDDEAPTRLNIQAMDDTWLLVFDRKGIEELFLLIPTLESLFRRMAQRTLSVLQKRLFLTVSASAEERYLALLERYPSIEQLVPQYQIASYLGIMPESLSRLKKQMISKVRQQP